MTRDAESDHAINTNFRSQLMTFTIQSLQRTVFFSTVFLFVIASTAFGQRKIETPPGVDYPRDNVTSGYRVDAAWPKGKSAYPWKAMPGIAIDEEGLIWTLNRGEMPVQVYTADGKLVIQWGKNYFWNGCSGFSHRK